MSLVSLAGLLVGTLIVACAQHKKIAYLQSEHERDVNIHVERLRHIMEQQARIEELRKFSESAGQAILNFNQLSCLERMRTGFLIKPVIEVMRCSPVFHLNEYDISRPIKLIESEFLPIPAYYDFRDNVVIVKEKKSARMVIDILREIDCEVKKEDGKYVIYRKKSKEDLEKSRTDRRYDIYVKEG
jgi:hypothetical protein